MIIQNEQEIVLYSDLSKIYNLKYILSEREKIKDLSILKKTNSAISLYDLDILIGLCYLYLPFCIHEEIPYWLKKEWDLNYSVRNIQSIIYSFQSRRAYQNFNNIILLDTEKVESTSEALEAVGGEIIKTNGFYFTKNQKFLDQSFFYRGLKSGNKKQKQIGSKNNIFSFIKNDKTELTPKDILLIKRFCYMYDFSDMNILEVCSEKKFISNGSKNDLIKNIQAEYVVFYSKIESKYFGGE